MKHSNPLDGCKRAANCTSRSRRSFLAFYLSMAAASIAIATTISVPFQSAAAASVRTTNNLKSKRSKESTATGAAKGSSSRSEGEGRLSSGSRPRSVIVDNHQPLVDEHITLDSAVRHHLSFVDPNTLSEFVVDNIADEVTFLKKTIPSFEKTCFDLEGPDVDSEDALLRCLKRVYYPTHPIYTGRSGMQRVVGMRHASLPAPIDLRSEDESSESNKGDETKNDPSGQSPDFADGISTRAEGQSGMISTELSALEDELLMSTNGWMPMQLINGSVYLCRMPRSGDNELVESDEDKTFVPKPKRTASKSKTKVEGGEEEEEEDQTFEQLKPGQKLPRSLRRELSRRLRGSKCATKAAGWWTYEVCWEDHVRQFHREGTSVAASHYLGQGPNKRVKDGTHADDVYYNVHSVRGPYLSQTLLNGSTCDITGEPRIAEIRLFCDENAGKVHATAIGLPEQASSAINLHMQNIEVSEPETCTYLVWMGSPKACLKQTRKRQGPIFGVRCRNVDDL